MNPQTMNIWDLVSEIQKQAPFTQSKIEAMLSIRLVESKASNSVYGFLVPDPQGPALPLLKEGVQLAGIELILPRRSSEIPSLRLDVAGACIEIDAVKEKYPGWALISTPMGRSTEEATRYQSTSTWGKLTFGFNQMTPACLKDIGFMPQSAP